MVSSGDVRWGKYLNYEGPYYPGRVQYKMADEGSPEHEKLLTVITATEGGRLDAVNMYDRCVFTAGLIQWCDGGQMSVCDMLGALDRAGVKAAELEEVVGAKLVWVSPKKFRWVRTDGEIIDTIHEQRGLYLGGSSGLVGGWTPEQRSYAKTVAAAAATVFGKDGAIAPQVEFTAGRLHWFQGPNSRKNLFHPDADLSNPRVAVARAAYISFAANLPAVADKMYLRTGDSDFGSLAWLIRLLRNLTFGPGIAIYPGRYGKIRPWLEQLYGVNLPDYAEELRTFVVDSGIDPDSAAYARLQTEGIDPLLSTPRDLQAALIRLGYDLGPSGADGVVGKRTTAAVRLFQAREGLVQDGIVGKATRTAITQKLMRT
jgi:hypothetical protein